MIQSYKRFLHLLTVVIWPMFYFFIIVKIIGVLLSNENLTCLNDYSAYLGIHFINSIDTQLPVIDSQF
jgi:hypothetical protein